MNWKFWKKPESIDTTVPPTPKPKSDPGAIDDWASGYGPWRNMVTCHCGQEGTTYGMALKDVCPRCGHSDKWESFVGREEWEQSTSRRAIFCGPPFFDPIYGESVWKRNPRIVRWTPENCTVEAA